MLRDSVVYMDEMPCVPSGWTLGLSDHACWAHDLTSACFNRMDNQGGLWEVQHCNRSMSAALKPVHHLVV